MKAVIGLEIRSWVLVRYAGKEDKVDKPCSHND